MAKMAKVGCMHWHVRILTARPRWNWSPCAKSLQSSATDLGREGEFAECANLSNWRSGNCDGTRSNCTIFAAGTAFSMDKKIYHDCDYVQHIHWYCQGELKMCIINQEYRCLKTAGSRTADEQMIASCFARIMRSLSLSLSFLFVKPGDKIAHPDTRGVAPRARVTHTQARAGLRARYAPYRSAYTCPSGLLVNFVVFLPAILVTHAHSCKCGRHADCRTFDKCWQLAVFSQQQSILYYFVYSLSC